MTARTARLIGLIAASFALAGSALAAPAADPAPLRICADPDNLPFSSNAPAGPAGFYLDYGRLVAERLGRRFEPVWFQTWFGKRAVRTELLSGKCDAWVGLPAGGDFMGPSVIVSKPFATIGYALVVPNGRPVTGFRDLQDKRVAVQFNSGPQILLAGQQHIESVTVLSPEAGLQALADGKVDAAFVWGPAAGYADKTVHGGRFTVVPVAGEGMQWPVAIGFARHDTALRDQVDQAVDALEDAVPGLAASYGFPTAAPITLAAALPETRGGRLPVPGRSDALPSPAVLRGSAGGFTRVAGEAPNEAAVKEGKEIFNGTCAHCHGPDAVQSERRINLRLLRHRYAERMDEVFHVTVTHGRPDKGMPNWSEVFTEDDFQKILAFLHTVQED